SRLATSLMSTRAMPSRLRGNQGTQFRPTHGVPGTRVYRDWRGHMTEHIIDPDIIDADNANRVADLRTDYDSLGERLDRRGISIHAIKAKIAEFSIAVPSWGVGTGGTR